MLLPKLPEVEEAPEPPVGALDLGEDVRLGRRRRPFGETKAIDRIEMRISLRTVYICIYHII